MLAVLTLVGGVPFALVRFVGWPLPRSVPSLHGVVTALGQHGFESTTLVDVLAIGVWVAWAAFGAEAIAARPGAHGSRLPLAGRLQPFVGALLGTVVLALAAFFARPAAAGASMPRPAITVPIRPPAANGAGMAETYLTAVLSDGRAAVSGAATNGAMANTTTEVESADSTYYVVREGDMLWLIAATHLGDAQDWRVIFELNRGAPSQAVGRSTTRTGSIPVGASACRRQRRPHRAEGLVRNPRHPQAPQRSVLGRAQPILRLPVSGSVPA